MFPCFLWQERKDSETYTFTKGLHPSYHAAHIFSDYRQHLTYLMAQDGLLHQPSVAVQPNPWVTPAPHRAWFPVPSVKPPWVPGAFKEGGSKAAAPSLWEAQIQGSCRAVPTLRPGPVVWTTCLKSTTCPPPQPPAVWGPSTALSQLMPVWPPRETALAHSATPPPPT